MRACGRLPPLGCAVRSRPVWLLTLLALAACTVSVPGSAAPAESGWRFVDERPCSDTSADGADEFSCVTLSVPTDHADPGGEHWDVTFGLHRAEGEPRGTFVVATGGPGSSGLAAADYYTSSYPAELQQDFDIVFFDQRGIGLSQEFRCDRAYYETFTASVDASSSAGDRDAFADAATQFGQDCFDEAGVDPATAPRYATTQAVEDLEAFREWLGAPALTLYGESYGTQYVQTYAAAHPDHVAALVVDGVVDLSTDVQDFAVSAARAYSGVLDDTLRYCDRQQRCADDAPGDSPAGYDQLAAQLTATPGTLDDGTEVDGSLLAAAAGGSMSVPYLRTSFQEALNAGIAGDLEPLADLAYEGTGPTSDFSDALFYAVECQDYDFVPQGGDPRAELDDWLDRAGAEGIDDLRLGGVYYGDTPCPFWPGAAETADAERPAPVTDPPYPVLVLGADTDPNTPVVGAVGVFRDLTPGSGPEDAFLLERGGPHVIYGWGVRCVDDVVNAFLTDGTLPADRLTVCPGEVADPY